MRILSRVSHYQRFSCREPGQINQLSICHEFSLETNSCGGVSVGPHLVCRWRHGPCGTLTINFVRPIVKLEEIFSSEQRTQRDIDIGASLAPVIFVSLSRETRAVTCDESVTSYGPAWARTVRPLE